MNKAIEFDVVDCSHRSVEALPYAALCALAEHYPLLIGTSIAVKLGDDQCRVTAFREGKCIKAVGMNHSQFELLAGGACLPELFSKISAHALLLASSCDEIFNHPKTDRRVTYWLSQAMNYFGGRVGGDFDKSVTMERSVFQICEALDASDANDIENARIPDIPVLLTAARILMQDRTCLPLDRAVARMLTASIRDDIVWGTDRDCHQKMERDIIGHYSDEELREWGEFGAGQSRGALKFEDKISFREGFFKYVDQTRSHLIANLKEF